jgi:hypothetical protein
MKNCKACKEPFEPRRPLQKVCSLTCSIDLVNQDKAKKDKGRDPGDEETGPRQGSILLGQEGPRGV